MKKKFRVAVEGKTIDGRELSKSVLTSIAKNFDPKFNTARINMEHFSGWSPDPPFNAYGTVTGLETREEEFTVGGKKEKLTCLVAEIDANEQLLEVNKKGQKIFTSIEYWPNFRGQADQFCLGGLAITDTPASFGTEPLKFTITEVPIAEKFKSAFAEFVMDIEPNTSHEQAQTQADNFFSALMSKIESLTAPKSAPKVEPPANLNQATNSPDFTALVETFKTGFEGVANQFANLNAKLDAATLAAKTANDDLASLKSELDNTQSSNFQTRKPSTGGASSLPRF